MVVPSLLLSPAQRTLAEKGLAVQRARQGKASQKAPSAHLPHAASPSCCSSSLAGDGARRIRHQDRSLIIRHVGEALARVALKEQKQEKSRPKQPITAPARLANHPALDESKNGAGLLDDDDGYDEEHFGPVRRPPRNRPPNLWVSIFEQEQAQVQRECETRKCLNLQAAEQFREQLLQQELDKRAKRKAEQQLTDAFAQSQMRQVAEWEALEKEKQRKKHEETVAEAQRCKEELRVVSERQRELQRKKAQAELRSVARYQAMIEAEKQQKEARKEQHMQEMAAVKQANAQQLELKRQLLLREQEEEIELQKAYERKLELQDQARQQELQTILANQSRKVKMALLNVKSAEERAREDEERAAIVQAQVRQKQEADLQRRAQEKIAGARLQARALAQQKEKRRLQHVAELENERAYARAFKQDFVQWQQRQQHAKAQVHERNHSYQAQIWQQMKADEQRRADEDKYGMSRVEMALNAALLKSAAGPSFIPPSDAHPR